MVVAFTISVVNVLFVIVEMRPVCDIVATVEVAETFCCTVVCCVNKVSAFFASVSIGVVVAVIVNLGCDIVVVVVVVKPGTIFAAVDDCSAVCDDLTTVVAGSAVVEDIPVKIVVFIVVTATGGNAVGSVVVIDALLVIAATVVITVGSINAVTVAPEVGIAVMAPPEVVIPTGVL